MGLIRRWWAALRGGGRRRVLAVDGALALVLGALAAEGSWSAAAGRGLSLDVPGYLLVALAAAGLVTRRLWPPLALAVSLGATLTFLALGYPYSPILQLVSVAVYSVAAWCPERVSLPALAVAVAGYLPLALATGGTPWASFGVLPLAGVWLVAPWLVGVAVRAYRRVRARAAEAERRGYVYEERLRIAREVHDLVGHGLTVINLQAGIALHVLERRPERAAEALRAVRQTSARALEDLRATLALEPLDGRRPAPGVDRLAELVEAVGRDGPRVDLEVDGPPRRLPAAVDLTCYRIVQEALTNVLRHAGARRVSVRVGYRADEVSVAVSDDGRGGAVPAGAGRGLVGMRERVGALAGTLTAGPRPGGGFEVRAVLPAPGAGGAQRTPE